jgi:hypothetical protein
VVESLLNDKAVSRLPLAERAKLKRLPEYLSIDEIVKLVYPDPETQAEKDDRIKRRTLNNYRNALKGSIIDACESGVLKYQGDIKGWSYSDKSNNPYPLAKSGYYITSPKQNSYLLGSQEWNQEFNSPRQFNDFGEYICRPFDCTIHKDEFKRYLKSLDQWPVDGLLANWWADDAQKDKELPKTNTSPSYSETEPVYQEREKDFDDWREKTGIDLEPLTVKNIFEQVSLWSEKKTLWNIGQSSFRRDFWQPYSQKHGLQKKGGRQSKNKI